MSILAPVSLRLRPEPVRSRQPLVSLTPLIDIVFILLIFLMLASSFADWRTITLNAPQRASAGGPLQGAVLLRIRAEGGIDVNGRSVALRALSGEIAARLRRDADQRFVVYPQEGVSLQRMVAVLDRVMEAGGRDISFLRDPGGGK